MKRYFIILIFLVIAPFAKAQYKTGIGIRGGVEMGISAKHFFAENKAVEGILCTGTHYKGILILGLLEIHREFDIRGLRHGVLSWFYGFGGHVGFFSGSSYYYKPKTKYVNKEIVTLSIDGILGVEFQFNEAPVVLGADFKPYFDVIPVGYVFWGGGMFARYVF